MKGKIRFAGKTVIFLCLLGMMVYGINRTLANKYRYNTSNPLTETYQGFYKMKRNTIDVLFLGSSHTATGFSPQELYNEFGIRSYNLGSNSQSLWASYYWLKEALQYQSPQAVVLDCYMLYIEGKENETASRQALDEMKWGTVKREAVHTTCSFDENQSEAGYFFTNIRFHSRWTGLNENDFLWADMATPPEMKGFWLYQGICNYQEYVPFEVQDTGQEAFLPEAGEYLDKIADLCRKNDIELVLVKTPTLAETPQRHNAIASYGMEHGLKFYDFNEKGLYESIGFDYASDMSDNNTSGHKNAHANTSGAKKLTYYIGQMLSQNHGLTAAADSQWEDTRAFHDRICKNFQLRYETDIRNYLSLIQDEQYTVFLAVKDDAASSMGAELQGKLRELGLEADWNNGFRKSYFAVIEQGQVAAEQMAGEKLEELGSFRDGEVIYKIVSAGAECGNDCSIQINSGEQAKRKRGLNIVVYSHDTRNVVDSVCFDTCAPELTASR